MSLALLAQIPKSSVASPSRWRGVQSERPTGLGALGSTLLAGLGLGLRSCRVTAKSFFYGDGASKTFGGTKPRIAVLEKSAKKGDHNAQMICGEAYLTGDRVEQSLAKAAQYFRMAAEGGIPKAQYLLGDMLINGEGVPANPKEGFFLMSRAAKANIVEAKYTVGFMLLAGQHVPKDAIRAIENLQAAADEGIREAYYPLGMAYLETSVGTSDAKSREMWGAHYLGRAASDATDSIAQYELGKVYLDGKGAEKDPKRAAELISIAANMGLADAQHSMGMLLLVGHGVEKNEEWAKYWFQEAAKQGCSKSQEQLTSTA